MFNMAPCCKTGRPNDAHYFFKYATLCFLDSNIFYLTNKEASTVPCSAEKHELKIAVEHERSVGENTVETQSSVFPTSFVLYRFLSALQQNRAQSRLFIC